MISKRLNLIVTGIFVAIVCAGLVSAAVTIIWTGNKSVKIDSAGTVTTDLNEITLLKGTNMTTPFVISNPNGHNTTFGLVLTVTGGTGVTAIIVESGTSSWTGNVTANGSKTLTIKISASLTATASSIHYELSETY